jgi:hypothetical protein
MSFDREQFREILGSLQDPGPLDPDNRKGAAEEFEAFHVPGLHGAAQSSMARLTNDIDVARGHQNVYLFSGTIGSGKSTELRKLAHELRGRGHYVVVIDAQKLLSPHVELGPVELLLGIAIGLWDVIAPDLVKVDPATGDRFNSLLSFFRKIPALEEITANLGFASLKTRLTDNPTFREKMRTHSLASLDSFVEEFGVFVSGLADTVREHPKYAHKDAKRVLIVDGMEHFGGLAAAGSKDKVFDSLKELFNTHSSRLRIPEWDTVYSVPPLLSKIAPGMANTFGAAQLYFLASAHVFRDRTETLDDHTITTKLIPMVQKRLGGTEVANTLIPVALQRQLIENTGGDLRDLLRAMRSALLHAYTDNSATVGETHLESVFNTMRQPYLPLTLDSQERMAQVLQTHEVKPASADDWAPLIGDLAQKRVLMYLNGSEWFGVHPLLRDAVRRHIASPAGA